ncbi:MAG: ATP-binding protein [Verrucomicrobia bacterium]|nr:ATP-binding protein [Verrucomicrobiota bacterium]MDA1066961.1 ATP-binding protein [Verrucomicrobiota bacterium]
MIIDRKAYIKTIRDRLQDYPVVALPGPRQAGKTTLAQLLAQSISNEEIHHFDLESPSDIARLANPELVLSKLKGLIILDEIQRMPELFPLLRVLADRPKSPARFLVLGSASPDLIKGASESLAGRVSFIDVSGFSLSELGTEHLSKSWWRGGFPRAYLARSNQAVRQWHEDFFRTFLERDIPQLGIHVPASTLRRFWTMVAHYHGQILKVSELARSLGSSEPTARRYLDILSGTYVVRQLPPWFENLKKRQVKSPKVYIRDSGILHALLGIPDPTALESHPKLGASWEGFGIEQVLAVTGDREAYFWATHAGAELDLLIFHKGKRLGIEFKYSEQPSTTKSMQSSLTDLGLEHLYIVHPGQHSFELTEQISAVTLPDLLDTL